MTLHKNLLLCLSYKQDKTGFKRIPQNSPMISFGEIKQL